MKHILIYGDSNTWGEIGFDGGRLEDSQQWPIILQTKLGNDFKIIQEGLGGRIAGDYEKREYRNGQKYFEVAFRSATPVATVVIALGTNDLKRRYGRIADQIYEDLGWYQEKIRELTQYNQEVTPEVLYLAPANFTESIDYFEADQELRAELIQKMNDDKYETLNLEELEMTEDGVHYSISSHEHVADLVLKKLTEISHE